MPDELPAFNFTARVRSICTDMVRRLPQLQHIDLDRVAFTFVRTRNSEEHGTQATLTPMRFEGGLTSTIVDGKHITVKPLLLPDGREVLYLFSVYLPRFMDQPLEQKLITILHELWHISPDFNGDLRRFPGRCYVHSTSEEEYDRQMAILARDWLNREPPSELYDFLRYDFARLTQQYPRITGHRITPPKLVPYTTDVRDGSVAS